ncbi:hypothetical protein HELRODRAFT_150569, partial [Helobdella robusta]|uniref:Uncharacterized protein n=1 Tax=Helobdella robusta TaxID=6412 RepID=T1EKG1_HELRO
ILVYVCVCLCKTVAAAFTGSLAIITSVIDSVVDLVSGAFMWWSSRAIKKRDPYLYPQGRTKLEPIAIVVLSVVMALASVAMIQESFNIVINRNYKTNFLVLAVVKLILFIVCRRCPAPVTQALAQDHRNDVLSNTGALAFGLIAAYAWKYADPIGAILISIYIIISWYRTGREQIKLLTGHTAQPDFLKKLTWIALNHHEKILYIDTLRAFHFGNNFLVEVDIVLPMDMQLIEAHDIGESLQIKLEKIQEVERAFVHIDYEFEHHPASEHK